jgi:hypothetical protein
MVILAACGRQTEPGPVAGSFFLRSIDGIPLPTGLPGFPDGSRVENGGLSFGARSRPRADDAGGLVTRTFWIRHPDNSLETRSGTLHYQVVDGMLVIDLCPIGALCALVRSELRGPLGEFDLVLTEYIGNAAGPVYRYLAELPD